MPWLTIAQIVMLVLWYTTLPTMPLWLVFLPLIWLGVWIGVVLVMALIAVLVAAYASTR